MGFLYQATSLTGWAIWFAVLFALMAFNELGRTTRWGGLVLFFVLPLGLTLFVWPTTAAPDNEYGTGTWFNWVKTYSALAGCLGFMAIRCVTFRCIPSMRGTGLTWTTSGCCRARGTS
jgi:hypothetical protein